MKGEVAADNADTADPLDLETWKADDVVAKRAMKAKNLIEIIFEFVYVKEIVLVQLSKHAMERDR